MLRKSRVFASGLLLCILVFFLLPSRKSIPSASPWMQKQIQTDLAFFQERSISKKKIALMATSPEFERHLFVKYSIRKNKIEMTQNFTQKIKTASIIEKSLKELSKSYTLPDIDFLVTMHDVLQEEFDAPVFSMAKNRNNQSQILIPDYAALRGRYQVLENRDITSFYIPWDGKIPQLFWRGTTSQHPLPGTKPASLDDPSCFTRVKLCSLSLDYPQSIDAKFTKFTQGTENLTSLNQFKGDFVSYEAMLNYKYLMLIDGNSCSFSASGWRWFTNSVVFKDNSDLIQWYYNELKPYVHYLPVKADLSDLLEQITWAKSHDLEAKAIAKNAREFAVSHITQEQNNLYLLHVLNSYSKLTFID